LTHFLSLLQEHWSFTSPAIEAMVLGIKLCNKKIYTASNMTLGLLSPAGNETGPQRTDGNA
jgi:hypothetical protein